MGDSRTVWVLLACEDYEGGTVRGCFGSIEAASGAVPQGFVEVDRDEDSATWRPDPNTDVDVSLEYDYYRAERHEVR